jgi:diacylglycerol kinase (ATP)
MSGRWLAIVNPYAGAIRHRILGPRFMDNLAAKVSSIALTGGPGDAKRIAAQALDYDGLVAVGGDGTVAQVLAGMDRTSQRLAVIPAGTGNCLALDLGLRSAEAALDVIAAGVYRHVDLMEATLHHTNGSISSHCLASTAGLGYAAEVALLAKQKFSRLHGYAYAAAAGFVLPRPRNIQLSADDGEAATLRMAGLIVNNTCHIGSARAFPAAAIDDGVLDAFLFRSGWFRQCLHDIEMVTGFPVFGTPRPLRWKTVRLHCDPPETVMLDGDLFDQVSDMEIVCRPAAVTCMGGGRC